MIQFSTSLPIYVAFNSFTALDGCGLRDRKVFLLTMLPSAPGEQSTISGPMMTRYFAETKSFDFTNLPSPPLDVLVSFLRCAALERNKSDRILDRKLSGMKQHRERPRGLYLPCLTKC